MLRDGGMAAAWTAIVSEDKLPEDEILQETPGIFQRYIEKEYEVRAVFFDNHDISVRINSQSHDDGKMDCRMMPLQDMDIEKIDIPDDVRRKCIKFMKCLGIRFGCFDFAVTEDGDYVFFEANEMGQFLWIEVVQPEIPMLSTFCQFVESAYLQLPFSPKNDGVTFGGLNSDPNFYQELKLEEIIHMDHESPSFPDWPSDSDDIGKLGACNGR